MTTIEFLKHIGAESALFIAGMSGGIAFLKKNKKMTISQKFLTVFSGGLSANYLSPLVADLLGINKEFIGGVAFIVGYTGLMGIELFITEIYLKYKK